MLPPMSRRLSLLLSALAIIGLSACSRAGTTVQYTVTTDTDAGRSAYLFSAVERVISSRLAVAGYKDASVRVTPTGPTTATLSVPVIDDAMQAAVDYIAADPFSIEMRLEDETVETGADDRWVATGIDASSLDWVLPIGDRKSGSISIELQFSADGRAALQRVFRDNPGRKLGIMVRGLLMSAITIPTHGTIEDRIIIKGVPSEKAAEIFAADVNVGLHISLTPAS